MEPSAFTVYMAECSTRKPPLPVAITATSTRTAVGLISSASKRTVSRFRSVRPSFSHSP